MKKEYILVIDSGIGGLSTLSEIIKKTTANYIYFADAINSPYGSHTKKELFKFISNIINNEIKKYNISIVVLACNTATASCIGLLRKTYPNIYFIGTEPAIVLASKKGYKKICSLTTPATSKQTKYKQLKASINEKIKTISVKTLAKNIEKYITNNTLANYVFLLKDIFYIAKQSIDYDCLVLGCTHYVFINDILTKFAKKPLVNGNNGVANQVYKIYTKKCGNLTHKTTIKFNNSYTTKFAKQKYIKILSQILAKL